MPAATPQTHETPADMRAPYTLDTEARETYAETGHLLLRGLLDADRLAALRPAILDAFTRHRPAAPANRPPTTYERAFIQVVNMGLTEAAVRTLSRSERLGAVAAQLMETDGARLFVEDAMYKPPGSGHTPWHQDASTLPVEPRTMVTAWIPLVPVDEAAGSLRFFRGSHRLGVVGPDDINDATDAFFGALLARGEAHIEDNPPMLPGDVSFHAGTTVHGAWPNRSDRLREVIALHYFSDGARLAPPDNPTRAALARHLAPTLAPGDLAATDTWPLVYRSPR